MEKTYTTNEARNRLRISPATFHRYRRMYRTAFVVVENGTGRGHPTRYDAAAIDHFRKYLKTIRTPYMKGE